MNSRGIISVRYMLIIAIGLNLLLAACFNIVPTSPASEQRPQIPARPGTLNGVELEVIIEPRESADIININPKAGPDGTFARGTTATIELLLNPGWEIEQWSGPVYARVGTTAKVNMDQHQTVIVKTRRIDSVAGVPSPDPTATAEPTIVPPKATPTRAPGPTATPSATPIPDPTSEPPTASFTIDVESGIAPLVVRFDNTSEGQISSVEWDFGDGETSTERSPNHRYTIAGAYDLTLNVSGPGGDDASAMVGAIIVESGPAAALEISPSSATLAVQEGTQFMAVARDEFGNVVPGTIAWAIEGEGGSIAENGLFEAETLAGSFADIVSVSFQTDAGELAATASVTVEPGPVARVSMEPTEVTLDIGATQQFSFTAFDEFDNETTDVIAAWTIPPNVGAIDTKGLLTLGTRAGTFPNAIRLETVKGTARASATANLTVLPDPLDTIEVEPSFAVVKEGRTQQFEAIGLDQYGNEIPELAYQWEVTGGKITPEGLFTAEKKPGEYEVSVEATFRGSREFTLIEVMVQISCSNVSEIPRAECEALIALFNATNGTNWTNNFGWVETDTPCSWRGVTCRSGHVTKLRLFDNKLSGSIPAELGNLANLTHLELDRNELTGSVPAELGKLYNLTELRLARNQLSGSIPVELGNLSNLTFLDLGINELTGSIPTELGNLSNLNHLDLFINKLSGGIPTELGNLSNLSLLDLASNQLNGSIPVELGNLSMLTGLGLNGNHLTGNIPTELGNLTDLVHLRIDANQLSGTIPAELGNLSNLRHLDLAENQLSETIPAELGNLSGLRSLNLSVNRLSGSIPVELGNLSNLTLIALDLNQLRGSIPVELGNLSNLTSLFLQGNQLSGPLPQNLTNLNLMDFRFADTNLCEPPDAGSQAWLASIDDLRSTGVICN